jgi:isoquinoline 1-oxidoreductase subunit beta
MGMKRRAFLIGGVALVGGGLFAIKMADSSARNAAIKSTTGEGEHSFFAWIKLAEDDTVTLYSPHIDFGQGSHTALAQMLADELDADWARVRVEQAPPEGGFGNVVLAKFFVGEMSGKPGLIDSLPLSWLSMIARSMPVQITGGSSAVRATGQFSFRLIGAAARLALIEEAADRLGVPAAELATADSKVTHARSGRSLRYGELAEGAAGRSLASEPALKQRQNYKFIGQDVARFDIPAKVDGSAVYAIDFTMPEMRVAAIQMAPVRDGKLTGVDDKPALAVPGVVQVVRLDDAVVVVAKGYWPTGARPAVQRWRAWRAVHRVDLCRAGQTQWRRRETYCTGRSKTAQRRLQGSVPAPGDDGTLRHGRALPGRQIARLGRGAGSAFDPPNPRKIGRAGL